MSDSLDRVKKATASLLKTDPARIKAESRFVQDLGVESMQSIELVAALENEFDLEMDEQSALQIKTVGDAARFIDRLRAGAK